MALQQRRKVDHLLRGEKLLLHYQPIFTVRTRQMASAEALLRVADEHGKVVSGGGIAGQAEDTGDIFALQERIAWSAFHDAARWQREGLDSIRLNLNLSARQFCDARMSEKLGEMIDQSGVPPAILNFEITETAYIEDVDSVARTLSGFAARGIQLWLDDFGTGHSSLTHLKAFPVAGLKVPGEFVKDAISDERTRVIVGSIIEMARKLDIETVAEGVERQDQFDVLQRLGCDYVQGFLLSKPLSLADLIRTGQQEEKERASEHPTG